MCDVWGHFFSTLLLNISLKMSQKRMKKSSKMYQKSSIFEYFGGPGALWAPPWVPRWVWRALWEYFGRILGGFGEGLGSPWGHFWALFSMIFLYIFLYRILTLILKIFHRFLEAFWEVFGRPKSMFFPIFSRINGCKK